MEVSRLSRKVQWIGLVKAIANARLILFEESLEEYVLSIYKMTYVIRVLLCTAGKVVHFGLCLLDCLDELGFVGVLLSVRRQIHNFRGF